MENNRLIDLKDLFFALIRKIWTILIVGAILGSALGGYKIAKRVKTYDILDAGTKLNSSETDIQYQLRVQNINKARGYVDMISRVNSQINQQRQYISNSIYMQINPDSVYQSTAQIAVEIPDCNINGMDSVLLSAYERELKSGDYLDEYANEINVKPEYIKELFSFNTSVSNNDIINTQNDFTSVSSMYILVIGPSPEFCDDVMNLIIDKFENVYSVQNSSVIKHSYTIVGIQQNVRIDDSLRTSQNNQVNKIDNLQKQITSYYDSLDKVAKDLGLSGRAEIIEYFDSHEEMLVSGIPTDFSEKNISRFSMLKSGVKYGAVGFILGSFITVVFILFKYLYGKKFTSQAQFFGEFSAVRKIGVMKPISKRSKFIQCIDRFTEDDTKLSDENCNKLIKFYYENLTHKYNKVLITGVCDPKIFSSSIKKLGLSGDCKPNMFNNPEVLEKLKDYDAVVLLEQRDYSLKKDVRNEISLISNSGKDIIGAIIF